MEKVEVSYEVEIGAFCPYCNNHLFIKKEDCGTIILCGECKKEFKLGEIDSKMAHYVEDY